MTFFTDLDFKKEFLDINFDEVLESTNNPIINSDIYLKYKQIYIEETNSNKKTYEELSAKINELTNSSNTNDKKTRIRFTYVNTEELEKIKYTRKLLYIEQQKKLNHFLHYINQLNTDTNYRGLSKEKDVDASSIKSNKSKKFRFFKSKK